MTREYPPEVYGGAGVHVEYLARELRAFEDVTVHAWGTGDVPHTAWDALAGDAPELAALRAVSIDLTMAAGAEGADIVHTHTWYAQLRRAPGQAAAGASRTSRPCTRSSRCGRGRRSSSAAATGSRASASGRRWRTPTP